MKEGEIIKKKRSKFNVDQTNKGKLNRTHNGVEYASELEMRYFKEVVEVGLNNGSIKKCEQQVKYQLQPKFKYNDKTILPIDYVADFVITYADDSVVVWDTKGLADATAKLKKKMFHFKYPDIDYRWVSYSAIDGGWLDYDVIQKARAKRKKEKKLKEK